ncbi:hypothetical protein C3B44_03715 [Corynebacterium yudongzhengii]|uniref:DUF3558 domain-containing protein n=1 Tax=Corynebacterium yudongzhengii TaxID=2080740 RepID=A0A2U1T6E4_9CORY|nr:DUF3558 family protein [Corynebacterium yudongzhengii]AWB81577.1 hypothetical protein C3B44_03715 [Corynebacterium yudongzhengii]PWC01562.1 DUF3558 domain-containing protein [Corynebacterium yudongzhengii]
MSRLIAIAVVAVAGSLVAACGLTGTLVNLQPRQNAAESAGETEPQELPPGFYLSGEFVELTKLDPDDKDLEPIRACEEIPPEVFEEAGIEPITGEQSNNFGMTSCGFAFIEDYETNRRITMTGGFNLVSNLVAKSATTDAEASDILPSLVTHQRHDEARTACAASLDTSRELLSVASTDSREMTSDAELCQTATSVAELIYLQLQGETYD